MQAASCAPFGCCLSFGLSSMVLGFLVKSSCPASSGFLLRSQDLAGLTNNRLNSIRLSLHLENDSVGFSFFCQVNLRVSKLIFTVLFNPFGLFWCLIFVKVSEFWPSMRAISGPGFSCSFNWFNVICIMSRSTRYGHRSCSY